MAVFWGILVIIAIVLVAGGIAYIGDRVGHQVGRKRLTLFGLRPKYTSTLVAVATGMAIALGVTLLALLASSTVQTAFFHIGELSQKVNELQGKADDLDKRVHETNVVVNRGDLLYPQSLLLTPQQAPADRLKALSTFYDAAVAALNSRYVPRGLRRKTTHASDPAVQKLLETELERPEVLAALSHGRAILLIVADQNLFPNDSIMFTFAPFADSLVFHKGQTIASVQIEGGTTINPQIAYGQAASAVPSVAIEAGMPEYIANATTIALSPADVQATTDAIRRGRGRFYLHAEAAQDVYPHSGNVPVRFTLSRSPR